MATRSRTLLGVNLVDAIRHPERLTAAVFPPPRLGRKQRHAEGPCTNSFIFYQLCLKVAVIARACPKPVPFTQDHWGLRTNGFGGALSKDYRHPCSGLVLLILGAIRQTHGRADSVIRQTVVTGELSPELCT